MSARRSGRFPGLNGLRAVAAFGVLVHHLELIKFHYGFPNLWANPAVRALGPRCVNFFFVLSGFLITYLLIDESAKFGDIDVKSFYVRRALRIWPLYFLIVFLSFFVLAFIPAFSIPGYPSLWRSGCWQTLLMFLLFVPMIASPLTPYASILWSVGVEEWFYAIWPWVLRCGRRSLVPICVVVIVFVNGILRVLEHQGRTAQPLLAAVNLLRFDSLAVGAICANVYFERRSSSLYAGLLRVIYRVDLQIAVYLCLLATMMVSFRGAFTVLRFLYGLVILNVATNRRTLISFETSSLRRLGDISYGIYCYNLVGIVAGVLIGRALFSGSAALVAFEVLGITITVGLAELSYRFVERPFLKMKALRWSRAAPLSVDWQSSLASG